MKRILVIEDDPDIQELIRNFLQDAGYLVSLAGDGMEGLEMFSASLYDLVLLDILMPKVDGYAVCEWIRKRSDLPIIILTALDGEEDQIKGLDLQVDDYITKPFSMPVLVRKIAAVLRRSDHASSGCGHLKYKDLVLDLEGYRAYIREEKVNLTQREFELLRELLMHQGKVLTRQMLLNKLWKYDFYGDERVVDTHIKNLRKKLNVAFIETIRGVGYRVDKAD